MEFNWLLAVGLFFASAALDVIFAIYILAIGRGQALLAGFMSLLTYALMAVGIVNYVENKWYIAPVALGAFVGTYACVRYEANKTKKGKST
jgi:divalent metal cation (Fe/Co/Zn/Cd) transporter